MTPPTVSTAPGAFARGVRDFMPLAPGMGSWALVTGVAMAKSGLSIHEALGLGFIGFAGAAQLAALPALVAGAGFWVPVMTALIVNLRFVIYSAGLTPYLRGLSPAPRWLAAYLVSDIGFALFMRHQAASFRATHREAYYFGVSIAVGAVWHAACTVGILAAGQISAEWGLGFAGTLALIALVVPMLRQRPALYAALAAGVTACVLQGLPYRLGTLVAILIGILVARLSDRPAAGEPA